MNLEEIKGFDLLVKAFLAVKTEKECKDLLQDLLTIKEIDVMAQRMLVAKRLSEKTIYLKIVAETGASTATISRVNRSYVYGTGAYKKVLKAIAKGDKK